MRKMANELPSDIGTSIDTALGAFNDKNPGLFSGTLGTEVVIIDGFAPFRWSGLNAQERWWIAAETWAKELAVLSEHIAQERVVHWQVVGVHGYVVVSATLTITLSKGDPIRRSGILTYTLLKVGDKWKVETQAWARMN
jgi:hypothetical protein